MGGRKMRGTWTLAVAFTLVLLSGRAWAQSSEGTEITFPSDGFAIRGRFFASAAEPLATLLPLPPGDLDPTDVLDMGRLWPPTVVGVVRDRRPSGLAICVGLCQLLAHPAGTQSFPQSVCGTYEYVYPHNTEQLVENHFIVLECQDEGLRGWYYGTSDDFDPGREGYLPGFFVVEMGGLAVSADSIRFTIQVREEEFFARAVPLVYRSAEELSEVHLERWPHVHGIAAGPRQYYGTVDSDSIILEVNGAGRVFKRVAGTDAHVPQRVGRDVVSSRMNVLGRQGSFGAPGD
jgi:hypothetical protein